MNKINLIFIRLSLMLQIQKKMEIIINQFIRNQTCKKIEEQKYLNKNN